MDCFLDLPTDILAHVVFPFLSLTDLGRLDIAVTNHLLRLLLFEVYPYPSLEQKANRAMTIHQMTWCFDRLIVLESIVCRPMCSAEEISAVFDMLLKSTTSNLVRHIDFDFNPSALRGNRTNAN
jgi:hypothetical protein